MKCSISKPCLLRSGQFHRVIYGLQNFSVKKINPNAESVLKNIRKNVEKSHHFHPIFSNQAFRRKTFQTRKAAVLGMLDNLESSNSQDASVEVFGKKPQRRFQKSNLTNIKISNWRNYSFENLTETKKKHSL